jgi:predicted NUDIX family NTP pyrophosphohydrolase
MVSNTMEVEWPPRSGKLTTFPEADRAAWFTTEVARLRIHPGQRVFIERLEVLDLAGCQGRS